MATHGNHHDLAPPQQLDIGPGPLAHWYWWEERKQPKAM